MNLNLETQNAIRRSVNSESLEGHWEGTSVGQDNDIHTHKPTAYKRLHKHTKMKLFIW